MATPKSETNPTAAPQAPSGFSPAVSNVNTAVPDPLAPAGGVGHVITSDPLTVKGSVAQSGIPGSRGK